MKVQDARTVADIAAAALPDFTRKFFAAGRVAFRKGDAETLHEFRIAAKKFRYALEIFAPVYGPRFAQKVAKLKKLQDVLGDLNDLVTVRAVVKPHESGNLLDWVDAQEADLRTKIEEYWSAMDAPGAEPEWIRYFSRYAGRAGKAAP